MATKFDKIIELIRSKYFIRVIFFIITVGFILTGFKISYGSFGCEKSKIDINDFRKENKKSEVQK
jgi:hypothetical protein